MISVYAVAYGVAAFAGASAADAGAQLYATGLFTTSIGLLVGIHREFHHAARLARIVAAYRHNEQFPGPVEDLAAIEQATAIPPGCSCETWWTSLGSQHDQQCPAAHTREDQS
jgi:hypothetical protein